MEQALVRFGRFVNDMEGNGRGDEYIKLAKFLLDSRQGGSEYDQSHLPVIQQYEAVGHAVRAAYTYSGMADVAAETHDIDYQSAVLSLWDNIVNKKYYLTGGIGSGETSEGFGPNYSLPQQRLLRILLQLRRDLLPVQNEPRLPRRQVRRPVRRNALQRPARRDRSRRHRLSITPTRWSDGQRTAWHDCPCCVGNIPRTLLMIPTWTYARGEDGLYVNLFIGSTMNVEKISGSPAHRRANGPEDQLSLERQGLHHRQSRGTKNFTVYVRVPNRNTSALYTDNARGQRPGFPRRQRPDNDAANGQRLRGDHPRLESRRPDRPELPMQVQRVTADPKIAADSGRVALRYGPLIYNVERADNGSVPRRLAAGL